LKRREREEADPRLMFFGGFGKEISEETLRKFAEQAGPVTKVKLFYNTQTWQSKGCAKVQYADQESADRAANEIAGTVLADRIVTVNQLGENPRPRQNFIKDVPQVSGEASDGNPNPHKRPKQAETSRHNINDDIPCQLPLSLFNADDSPEAKLQICYAAFEDLLENYNPDITGAGTVLMVRKLITEVNNIFATDEESLHAFLAYLRGCRWFRDNNQRVGWQASKKRVSISQISKNTLRFSREQRQELYEKHWAQQEQEFYDVEQRKREQHMMGKDLFEVPEAEQRPASLSDFGKGKGKGKKGWGYR